jgi:hypothetical protein
MKHTVCRLVWNCFEESTFGLAYEIPASRTEGRISGLEAEWEPRNPRAPGGSVKITFLGGVVPPSVAALVKREFKLSHHLAKSSLTIDVPAASGEKLIRTVQKFVYRLLVLLKASTSLAPAAPSYTYVDDGAGGWKELGKATWESVVAEEERRA